MNQAFTQKLLVQKLLEQPLALDWTLQGLGMLRTYLAPEVRLHVWDPDFKFVEDGEVASELHTHPWDFESVIIAGCVRNYRFVESDGTSEETGGAIPVKRQTIKCGEGGGLIGEPVDTFLTEQPTETYREGDTYTQEAHEIHKSLPEPGTVTIIERNFLRDTEHAYVYFKREWVSAEPRPATTDEIHAICNGALEKWFEV